MNTSLQRYKRGRAFPVAVFLAAVAPGVYGFAFAQGLPASRSDMVDPGRTVSAAPASVFDQLSPGSRMIAKSLVWAQGDADFGAGPVSGNSRWSLEKISAARIEGLSWGEVFRQMKAEGLVTARTLGEIVNSYYRPVPVSTSSEPGTSRGRALNAPDITRTDSPTGANARAREKVTP